MGSPAMTPDELEAARHRAPTHRRSFGRRRRRGRIRLRQTSQAPYGLWIWCPGGVVHAAPHDRCAVPI